MKKQQIISGIIGGICGAVIGFPLGFIIGYIVVKLFDISNFEGGSGFAVIAVMTIVIPLAAAILGIVNILYSRHGLPNRLLAVE